MDFTPEYCKLLRKQVEEEITYLMEHGHNHKNPTQACIFCHEYKGHNMCQRVNELKRFLSEIMVKMNMSPIQAVEYTQGLSQEPQILMPLVGFSS